jgi:hypothetical protein
MTNLRFLASVFAVLGSVAVATGCSSNNTDTPDATLRVNNQSDFAIVDLRIAPVGTTSWGPNQLDADLQPGETITLGVTCDTYDVQLIDETNVDCTLNSVDLCGNDADWVIHNDTCTVFNAVKAPDKTTAKAPGSAAK